MTRFIEMKTNAPSPRHGWSRREHYTRREEPHRQLACKPDWTSLVYASHTAGLKTSFMCKIAAERAHVLKQGRVHVFVAERRGWDHSVFTAASLNRQDQGAATKTAPNTGRRALILSRPRGISSCVCDDQNRYLKPKPGLFRVVFVLKPDLSIVTMEKCKAAT